MAAFTTRERLRYAFDSTLSRGTPALIGWLAVASAALIVVIALPVWAARWAPLADGRPAGFVEVAWMSLMRTLDAGTMGGDAGAGRSCSPCSPSRWAASSSSAR